MIDAERKYDVLGGDQIGFLVFGLEEAQRLLEDPRVIGAARRANIAMMRKRACFYARYHCPQLADDILETPV
ncbi:hypothetical protein CKO28_18490 [Rhodovibrio sodomensis]|uniref:Uncharacterized protein n=1 Tax=Rhodovibrio sodomensis TaxID=1088 RepID=A0ABS1DJ46_9PROT|nr:hypothetical protein [Rhodovibrio sodomensis]